MDAVLMKAQELADAICASEAFLKMKGAKSRMAESDEAVKANAEYDAAYLAARQAMSQTSDVSEAAMERLRQAKEKRDTCKEIADYLACQKDFDQMMDNVNTLLRVIVVGESVLSNTEGCQTGCSLCPGCRK